MRNPQGRMDIERRAGNEKESEVPYQDAGALIVLKSKGSWLHCGFHLTTSIVCPPLLSLPFAFRFLGWGGGIAFLIIGALVTFYSYNLLSIVLEHQALLGQRQLRYGDMATHVLGRKWGDYYVRPVQFLVCYGAVVACILLGGQCTKAVYLLVWENGSMKLYQFVMIFGCVMLIISQIPSFHSLRHINMISILLCLAYSACATAASIHIGVSSQKPKDYSLSGRDDDRAFGALNAIAIIATTYGNAIIPEIQATLAPPVKGKMFKGLCVCYFVLLVTFFSVAVSGYWAFGNQSAGLILLNFMDNGNPLVPKWLLLLANILTLLQLLAVAVVYLQPTNELLERLLSDPKRGEFSIRNAVPRLIARSISVIIAAVLGAMLPFFGDINALIGAFGFIPLDFVLPSVFYNLTFKPSKKGFTYWITSAIAVAFSGVAVAASAAAVRQIILDANTYKLFANV